LIEVDLDFVKDRFNLDGLKNKTNSEESSASLDDPATDGDDYIVEKMTGKY
jgi:hypothetical protein